MQDRRAVGNRFKKMPGADSDNRRKDTSRDGCTRSGDISAKPAFKAVERFKSTK